MTRAVDEGGATVAAMGTIFSADYFAAPEDLNASKAVINILAEKLAHAHLMAQPCPMLEAALIRAHKDYEILKVQAGEPIVIPQRLNCL